MKLPPLFFSVLACASVAFAGDRVQLPGQAGNDAIDLEGTILTTPNDMSSALDGKEMQPGYVIVQLKVIPKTGKPLRVGPDDFILVSHKNGERSSAAAPNQVAGGGSVLVVRRAADQPGGDGTTVNGPVWGGVSVRKHGSGNNNSSSPQVKNAGDGDHSLVQVLTDKAFHDKEYKAPVEGLLYFGVDGKLKAKDLSLIYDGQGGKLIIDFK